MAIKVDSMYGLVEAIAGAAGVPTYVEHDGGYTGLKEFTFHQVAGEMAEITATYETWGPDIDGIKEVTRTFVEVVPQEADK